MIPQTGQHVKCILRNGAIAEGIVEEWRANTVQLKSLDGESVLIITHPAEDIMLIKIILDKPEEDEEPLPAFSPDSTPWEHEEKANYDVDSLRKGYRERLYGPDLEEQFKAAARTTDINNIDEVKSLTQLRIELNKKEREIIAAKLRDHRPSQKPPTNPYSYPPIIMKDKPRKPNG